MVREIDPTTASVFLKDNDAGLLFPVGYGKFYAVFLGGEVVCMGELSVHSKTAKIRTIYTFPHQRHKGYATKLVKYMIGVSRNYGVKTMMADCLKTSLPIFIREGAEVVRTCKNGVHKVKLALC
jgi:GNAT superfamily N-acetyltransferase